MPVVLPGKSLTDPYRQSSQDTPKGPQAGNEEKHRRPPGRGTAPQTRVLARNIIFFSIFKDLLYICVMKTKSLDRELICIIFITLNFLVILLLMIGPFLFTDYEDEIMLVETGKSVVEEPPASDKCETKGDSDLQPFNAVSTKDINNGQGTKEKPTNIPAAEKIEDQGYSKSSTVEVKGDIRTVHKVDLMFQESQVNVSQNPSENTDSVSHKHNGPYVFHDEESSQGGRDVNENLGL
ncbi:uncharacterized protein LOC119587544 [Penaeus monodon]|uniref:uncharacterized protein LOC119587544 n=1 Tax=Penaeus monodon TaxID=6687 RepID=UPI0018A7D046|nr:uncharacterized protein LOC119587544 [Penaeus monodon]